MSANPTEEKWNPVKWRGKKWVTLRPTSTGLYAEVWYEYCRDQQGRVTLLMSFCWDEEKQTTINLGLGATSVKKLSELYSEEQASEILLAADGWHPATMLMCGCSPGTENK